MAAPSCRHLASGAARRKKALLLNKSLSGREAKTFGPGGCGNAAATSRRTKVFFASFLFTKKKCFLPS
jgi:hypothetical protein